MGHAAVPHPSLLHCRRYRRHVTWYDLAVHTRSLLGTWNPRASCAVVPCQHITLSCTASGRAQRIAYYCGQLLGCWFILQAAE